MAASNIAVTGFLKIMFDAIILKTELCDRVGTIRRILAASQDNSKAPDISREARGLAILLLFAAYENLLKSLCRSLLETARRLKVGNRRLRTGFRVFAIHSRLQAMAGNSSAKVDWTESRKLLEDASRARGCSINSSIFPNDGSFMKSTQVRLLCELFDLGDPAPVLREVWDRLDSIVSQRNLIAHGSSTPEDVGRGYTSAEIEVLVDLWERRWSGIY